MKSRWICTQQPNYSRKIASITVDVCIQKNAQDTLLGLKWLYFRSGIIYQMYDSGSADQRLHAVTTELTSNKGECCASENANYSNFLIRTANKSRRSKR